MKTETKRKLLRPIIAYNRWIDRKTHPIRTTEEIVKMRDEVHRKFIISERTNKADMMEFKHKTEALNWVLKQNANI